MNQINFTRWDAVSEDEKNIILSRPISSNNKSLIRSVLEIISNVKLNGDQALLDYTAKWDGVNISAFKLNENDISTSIETLNMSEKRALEHAATNIQSFHEAQLPKPYSVDIEPGITCGFEWRPIETIGLYAPGGATPLPSTVLMTGIPAKLAGCKNRILCTPPQKDGHIHPAILYAARLCDINLIFTIGGAQAIAAMAFGTESIPKVDKIFGPGNSWVTTAKSIVSTEPNGAAIDMPAGPSEVLIIADSSADPSFVASDFLAQLEHGPDSQAILVSSDSSLFSKVQSEIDKQLPTLLRKELINKSLEHSRFIFVSSIERAIEISNTYAPEHLILQIELAETYVPRITSAGSIFLGPYSPESAGDYASGTNHVLPTNGYANRLSGLSVSSYFKHMTVQSITKKGLARLAPTISALTKMEGLDAHNNSITTRLEAHDK